MIYRVIKTFTDMQDNNHKYSVGDTFPRTGLSVTQKRLEELLTIAPSLADDRAD